MKKFLVFILFAGFVYAQSLEKLEKRFDQLNNQYDKESLTVDSLKSVFSKKAEQIDFEKKKNNPDKTLITDLMASSIIVSNDLEEHNNKIQKLEKDLDNVKEQLNQIYLSKIDSLENLKKTGKEDENKLDNEILLLTGKRLLVAPRILSLSFNPDKVLRIDLSKTTDPKEKALYKEYLNNALGEVNSLLGNVNKQSSEASQIADLQKKTERFLEEAELENKVLFQKQSEITSSTETTAPGYETGVFTRNQDFQNQVQTYQLILRQLDIEQISKSDITTGVSFNEQNKNLSLKDYIKLLKEVKKRLQEFKLVLANKIGSSR
jgi:hypothetical protein